MMSYCDLWEYETKDFLLSCIENGFDNNISKEFFERFSITDYEMAIERKGAKTFLRRCHNYPMGRLNRKTYKIKRIKI